MRIPSRHTQRRLRLLSDQIRKIQQREIKPVSEMAGLIFAQQWLERDLALVEESKRPDADLALLWPTIAGTVGNVEPIGLHHPQRPDDPVACAACLRAALAILRLAIADLSARFAALEERRVGAVTAFTLAATAALAAGEIVVDPADLAFSEGTAADGADFVDRLLGLFEGPAAPSDNHKTAGQIDD